MKILALEPFYGGSHQAFLDGWSSRSKHEWTILHLPASHWKWRMRHAAITFAKEVIARFEAGERWDIIFCSDMLDLATLKGLVGRQISGLKSVAYFHENQLTYPVREEKERDNHFAITNLTTCLAADSIWFNSEFHLHSFLDALPKLLRQMPDHQLTDKVGDIRAKASVLSPGIDDLECPVRKANDCPHILWAARWEHDKNPEAFFKALDLLKSSGVKFRVSVIGEQFEETPSVFAHARDLFKDEIVHWGYQSTREKYLTVLQEADVVVSTAIHEFFGVGVVEAIASGAYPLLPPRLSYPELLMADNNPGMGRFFYDGTTENLHDRLIDLADRHRSGSLWEGYPQRLTYLMHRFRWKNLVPVLDRELENTIS